MSRPLPHQTATEAGTGISFRTDLYDRSPLDSKERAALEYVAGCKGAGRLVQNYAALERLVRPIQEAAEFASARSATYHNLRKHLCRQMHRRAKTFWEFSEEEWTETVALSKHGTKRCALVVGYLLGGISGARLLTLDHKPTVTARKALGEEAVEEALSWLSRATEGWGYERRGGGFERLEAALCRALLLRGSPRPEEVNDEVIEVLLEASRSAQLRKTVRLLSRVLYAMGVPVWPIPDPRDAKTAPRTAGLSGDHISPEWIGWADRWRDTSTQESREHTHMYLLKIGRWLAQSHPEVSSPEQWDQELAVEYVAAVDRMKTGDWGSEWARLNPHRAGKPSMPRSKDHQLRAARAFFRDLQEWGWIEVRFDPGRCLRTPRSIKDLIGPDPKTIDDAVWAKLVAAGLNLTAKDLPRGCPYPAELVRALAAVWLFAGLRANEIVRLRVGCVRRQRSDVTVAATGETLKKDTICLLHVPTNKTATAFTKPVHPIVGQRIAEWECKRPQGQPASLDPKTGELVHFLFSVRNRPVARAYLNNCLIPLLCRKGGVLQSDSRGKITSHRARATIASQLYNGPEPLSLTELQAWLGHKDPKSTQSYARIDPTKLAKKYADSGYLERNMALIEVLLDVEALREGKGDAALYYELGHGLCSNPYWYQCPYRMACVKCEFYVAGEEAQYVRARKGIRHMLEKIPLTEEERRAAEGDERALDELLNKNADVPTPAGPTPRQLGIVPLTRKPTREAGHST